jgi:hypothetical protein
VLKLNDISGKEFRVSPHGFMVKLGGESGK